MGNLFVGARACLDACDPDQKLVLTQETVSAWQAGRLGHWEGGLVEPRVSFGHPDRPVTVAPRDLPQRRLNGREGLAALIHAIAHIEFSAINLAWDAVYRFRGMPRDYYDDWVRVAAEEAQHFRWLREHLRSLGYDYGDFEVHAGLWEMAEHTAHDPLIRMALVPRVLEARGLDATPQMIERLRAVGDESGVAILKVILSDEIGHVAAGSRWFRYLCIQRGLDPGPTFRELVMRYFKGHIKGPLNREARLQAGFSVQELADLERRTQEGRP